MPAWSINLYNIPSPIQEASLFFIRTAAAAKSLQLCPTLSNRMDCSLPGFLVHGIFQARVLEWVAIAFSIIRTEHLPNIKMKEQNPNGPNQSGNQPTNQKTHQFS